MEASEQNEIPFSDEQKTQFYEQLGSANFKLQGEVNREYARHIVDVYFKSVGFAATVVGTVGIIAGFGFTALSFVESPLLFFIGEGLLIYSILHGLIWIQSVYKGEFDSLDKAHTKHQEYFSERNKKFKSVWEEISKTGKIKEADLRSFFDLNAQAVQLFAPPEPAVDGTQKKEKTIFSKKLYYLMIAGSICLLSSFFIYSLITALLWFLIR
ncbi:MAG: hypothetical protein P4M11_10550 [Candidatus Pacebacteria bacterium]|nr:hypothetical protein [Candidatus Paceibacterota bacterium]